MFKSMIDGNFEILVDKFDNDKAGIQISFSPKKIIQIQEIDEQFRELASSIAAVGSSHNAIDIKILADVSGSMNSKIGNIREIIFLEKKLSLPNEICGTRFGAQIYTIAITTLILKHISKLLESINKFVAITIEIIPFSTSLHIPIKIDINACENPEEIVIDLFTQYEAEGTTNASAAILYTIENCKNTKIPTIVIMTTDGVFSNSEYVTDFWDIMIGHENIIGGCIGMGNDIFVDGIKKLNRGGCLINGSFDSSIESDSMINLMPNILNDFMKLHCEKAVPQYIKLICKNKNEKLSFLFDSVMYTAKSYEKIMTYVSSENGIFPELELYDENDNVLTLDINNMQDSNIKFGVCIYYLINTFDLTMTSCDRIQDLRETILEHHNNIKNLEKEKKKNINANELFQTKMNNAIENLQNDIKNLIKQRTACIVYVRKEFNDINAKLEKIKLKLESFKKWANCDKYLFDLTNIRLNMVKQECIDKITAIFNATTTNKFVSENSKQISSTCTGGLTQTIIINQDIVQNTSSPRIRQRENDISSNNEKIKCPICLDNDAVYLAYDCGHLISCDNNETRCMEFVEYSRETNKCPICMSELNDIIPVVDFIQTNNTLCQICDMITCKYILNCGHIGVCNYCKKDDDDAFYNCKFCNKAKKIMCKIFL